MSDAGQEQREAVDCLLFEHGGERWLTPAAAVAEVVPHFENAPPRALEWRGESLRCDGDAGPVRALLVLRELGAHASGFHALALAEPPRPCRVLSTQIGRAADGATLLDGEPVRIWGADSLAKPG